MASSSNSRPFRFQNIHCLCGLRAAIKISESEQNKNMLYYCCPNKHCKFFRWCSPMEEEVSNERVMVDNGNEFQSLNLDKYSLKTIVKKLEKLEKLVVDLKTMCQLTFAFCIVVFIVVVVKV